MPPPTLRFSVFARLPPYRTYVQYVDDTPGGVDAGLARVASGRAERYPETALGRCPALPCPVASPFGYAPVSGYQLVCERLQDRARLEHPCSTDVRQTLSSARGQNHVFHYGSRSARVQKRRNAYEFMGVGRPPARAYRLCRVRYPAVFRRHIRPQRSGLPYLCRNSPNIRSLWPIPLPHLCNALERIRLHRARRDFAPRRACAMMLASTHRSGGHNVHQSSRQSRHYRASRRAMWPDSGRLAPATLRA